MEIQGPRILYLAHASEGRTRVRVPGLRGDAATCRAVAEELAGVAGIDQVQARPKTGSLLVLHDPEELDADGVIEAARKATGIELVIRPGEDHHVEEADEYMRALPQGEAVARSAATFFKMVNRDVLRATGGHLDLGTLTSAAFLAAGAAQVVASGKLPLPQWFNLSWYALGMFTRFEKREIDEAPAEV